MTDPAASRPEAPPVAVVVGRVLRGKLSRSPPAAGAGLQRVT